MSEKSWFVRVLSPFSRFAEFRGTKPTDTEEGTTKERAMASDPSIIDVAARPVAEPGTHKLQSPTPPSQSPENAIPVASSRSEILLPRVKLPASTQTEGTKSPTPGE